MKHDNTNENMGGADAQYPDSLHPFYAKYQCYPTTHELVDELLSRLVDLEDFIRDSVLISGHSSTLPTTLREDTASCLMEIGRLLNIYERRETGTLKEYALKSKQNRSGWKPGYARATNQTRLVKDLADELQAHLAITDGMGGLVKEESLEVAQQLVDAIATYEDQEYQ